MDPDVRRDDETVSVGMAHVWRLALGWLRG